MPLPEVAAQVQEAFAALGYAVRIDEAGVRSARLHLRLPVWQDELEVDLLKEALEPRWLTVEVAAAAHLQAVSLDDAVGMKARAWHDRFVPRDIIDLHAVAATGSFSCVDIESLGRRHAPELDLEVLLEHLYQVSAPGLIVPFRPTGWMSRPSAISAGGSPSGTTTSTSVSPPRTTAPPLTIRKIRAPDACGLPRKEDGRQPHVRVAWTLARTCCGFPGNMCGAIR